jgi:hypothetical protein
MEEADISVHLEPETLEGHTRTNYEKTASESWDDFIIIDCDGNPEAPLGSFGKRNDTIEYKVGVKETQNVEKAPIFTYCKVNKNALEALSLRALYGHKKYEKENDWENFSRVPNGDFEYSNAMFRHALEIGGEEDEKEHLIASAWNAISRLEIYLRSKN